MTKSDTNKWLRESSILIDKFYADNYEKKITAEKSIYMLWEIVLKQHLMLEYLIKKPIQ